MEFLFVANGSPPSKELLNQQMERHPHLVAVDGGLDVCLRYGFVPEYVIGDFDSCSEKIRSKYPRMKKIYAPDPEKTDLEKAFDYFEIPSAESVVVCGALGGRIDHSLTNICLLCRYPGKVRFETDGETCLSPPKEAHIPCEEGQTVSLLPASSNVTEVSTAGLKWELNKQQLNKTFFSTSNICLGSSFSVSHKTGDLVLCLVKKHN